GPGLGPGVGRGHAAARPGHARDVGDVVADVNGGFGADAAAPQPRLQNRQLFVGDDALDAQFFGAAAHHRIGLAGEDQQVHALAPQPGHGPAVAPVAGHGFGAAFADVHPVVGEDAVQVHDHGVHPPGPRGGFVPLQAPAQQRFRHGEVRCVVDFQAAVGRDFVDGGPAGKPMARPQEGRDPQGVDGARFFELVPQLLAHRAVGLVVSYWFVAVGRPAPVANTASYRYTVV